MDTSLFADQPVAPQSRLLSAFKSALRPGHWFRTLKSRLVAGALVAMLVAMATMAWRMAEVAEAQLLAQAEAREHAEARQIAGLIGRRMREQLHALRLVGDTLDAATLNDAARLGDFLEGKVVFRAMFATVFAVGVDGQLRVTVDPAGRRAPGVSVADRDYFKRTLSSRQAVISAPVEGRVSGEPVVIVTQPLLQRGEAVGLIGGTLRLASHDLLEDLASKRAGDDGALVLISDAAGKILAHPHRARLLDNIATEPGLADVHAHWPARVDPGAPLSSTWVGPHDLVAVAVDPLTRWSVWRITPRDALLAPVQSARRQALRSAIAYGVAMAALFLCFVAWQLRPLVQLERRAARLITGDGGDAEDWPCDSGEIGKLSRTLHHVWAERAQVESFNAQVLQKLGSVMAAAPVGLAFTRNQRFELVSAEWCRMLGRPDDLLLGQLAQVVFASNEDYLALGPQVGAAFARGDTYVGDWQVLRGDGSVFWGRLHARPVTAGDPSQGTIWSMYDVSEQIDDRRRLEHAAMHDALTGVTNRKGFDLAIATTFAGRSASHSAVVVMIDLDHFKPINDTAGHAAGDAVLKAVAAALASQVRGSDVVARIGGDEFAVLLPGCDLAHAQPVAAKLRDAVAALALPWGDRVLKVGASLGLAAMSIHHRDCAEWLAEADADCYAAKRLGRTDGPGANTGARLRLVDAA